MVDVRSFGSSCKFSLLSSQRMVFKMTVDIDLSVHQIKGLYTFCIILLMTLVLLIVYLGMNEWVMTGALVNYANFTHDCLIIFK